MSQSLARVILHTVFSTKNRVPMINPEIEKQLFGYMGQTCNNHKCPVILINGTSNHVHILCGMSRTITIADLIEDIKTGSSRWIKTVTTGLSKFSWQNGYGVFSVDWKATQSVRTYIASQKEHHKSLSFEDEYRKLLRDSDIPYDEKYVWD
jgi:putative transposase